MNDFEKGNMSTITKKGNTLYKSKPYNSQTMKRFLNYMEPYNLNIPKYLGETSDKIHLSYVKGNSIHSDADSIPFEKKVLMISSAAKLLATFHRATENFPVLEEDQYFLSYNGSFEIDVICHNDFAPYNVTFEAFEAVGLIDFDTICPAPREWDIAYALYRFILIDKNIENEYQKLIKVFLSAYDYKKDTDFFPIIIERIQALVRLFDDEISKNNQSFIEMERNGHKKFYIEEVQRISIIWANDDDN
ncbi:phosphotransferase [uncultured Enterococcus sp.]|uniref:phosphotransferase n=1 Tax=uncultured Enterococcus sp. TaxID=167972 RepID=UPI002AA70A23|nr:phosphotransferase [uncultured Enterococcus sp.]